MLQTIANTELYEVVTKEIQIKLANYEQDLVIYNDIVANLAGHNIDIQILLPINLLSLAGAVDEVMEDFA